MSPEQASGKEVDKRTDIWAFAVVLYEMLAGRRLFDGATVSDTLAAVLKTEPDLTSIPAQVRPVVERCLRKDPRRRWRDIGDVRMALEDGLTAAPTPPPRRTTLPWTIAAAVVALIAAVALWALWRATRPVDHPLTRLSVDLGPDAMTGLSLTVAISPDGRRLVFPARGPDGKQQLATRLLDQAKISLLPGTENGRDPFFSPDSQWVGFFADGKLKKISVQGGAPVILCSAPFDLGASWGKDETIIASMNLAGGLLRVPAAGGSPQPITKLGKGEVFGMESASVEAISSRSGVIKTLVTGGVLRPLTAFQRRKRLSGLSPSGRLVRRSI
jgi:hypothetical protein